MMHPLCLGLHVNISCLIVMSFLVSVKRIVCRAHRHIPASNDTDGDDSNAMSYFGFKLPSVLLNISSDKFIRLYDVSDNVVCTSLRVN